ncbi:MAG: tetratricopeptide repeat protein [Verrucomicrobia bacterium]|nr:tetratricopeptide repeat protein [Verrucomicrobiota bacterium]
MLEQRRLNDAIVDLREALRLQPAGRFPKSNLGVAYAFAGQRAEAMRIAEELTQLTTSYAAAAFDAALVNIGLGKKTESLDWLEKAVAAKAFEVWQLKVNPAFDSLHSDERFIRLLKQIGLDQ